MVLALVHTLMARCFAVSPGTSGAAGAAAFGTGCGRLGGASAHAPGVAAVQQRLHDAAARHTVTSTWLHALKMQELRRQLTCRFSGRQAG